MMSKWTFLSLFFAFTVEAQSRPTGGRFPELSEGEMTAKVNSILSTVTENMEMCGPKVLGLKSMKELSTYLSDVQNKKVVKVVGNAADVAKTDNTACDKPAFTIISDEVSCLLAGAEESINAFAINPSSVLYLETTLGVDKKEAGGLLNFLQMMNAPGFSAKQKSKEKKLLNLEDEKGDI